MAFVSAKRKKNKNEINLMVFAIDTFCSILARMCVLAVRTIPLHYFTLDFIIECFWCEFLLPRFVAACALLRTCGAIRCECLLISCTLSRYLLIHFIRCEFLIEMEFHGNIFRKFLSHSRLCQLVHASQKPLNKNVYLITGSEIRTIQDANISNVSSLHQVPDRG